MVDRRLGRGLDFFLSEGRGKGKTPDPEPAQGALEIELSQLSPSPHQPRGEIVDAELQELASSIRASGILQPILVRTVGQGYEIVAGERRWRAARLAGLERVPVLIRSITDDQSAVYGLVENIQREDLNAIEKAVAFRKLKDLLQCNQDEIARRVGLDRSTVANFMRLLDLPEQVQAHVSRGTLTMGHARALLALTDAETQLVVADQAIRGRMSVRDLEALVKEAQLGKPEAPASKGGKARSKQRPVWLNEIEENLVDALGTPVTVRYGRKRSQIVIECVGREQFERMYEKLKDLSAD